MKVGDKVIVTKQINSHEFGIGEEVELIYRFYDGSWKCKGKDTWWCLTEEEFELLNQ